MQSKREVGCISKCSKVTGAQLLSAGEGAPKVEEEKTGGVGVGWGSVPYMEMQMCVLCV
jgi:hypothetical protein